MEEFLNKYGGFNNWCNNFDNIWVTSDLHLGHEKIKNFEPIREELRVAAKFEGSADEYLVYTWNKQVGENDLVINLGDLHWRSYEPFAEQLNGVQLLVLGNHDSKPQYYNKFPNIYVVEGIWNLNGVPSKYYVNSKDKLLSGFIYENVLFSHYPVYNIEHEYNYQRKGGIIDRMKIFQHIVAYTDGDIRNIHGHMHSSCPEGSPYSINVCYDFNKYKVNHLLTTLNKVRRM